MNTRFFPKISVVMAVKNGMPFLEESVKSVLGQTYKNFEFIIVEDGSGDDSWKYLKSIGDSRIRLFKNKKNLGLAKSLNIGIRKAKGEFIARMDADDACMPDRFQKQISFLNKHKDYILVGSQVLWIDSRNKLVTGFDVPEKDDQIRKKLFWKNQIHHASVMFRKSSVIKIGGYRTIFNGAEDYDLWLRILKKGKIYNLKDRLLKRRIHPNALTQKKHIKTEVLAILVRILNFSK